MHTMEYKTVLNLNWQKIPTESRLARSSENNRGDKKDSLLSITRGAIDRYMRRRRSGPVVVETAQRS